MLLWLNGCGAPDDIRLKFLAIFCLCFGAFVDVSFCLLFQIEMGKSFGKTFFFFCFCVRLGCLRAKKMNFV